MRVLNAAQMREADRRTTEDVGIPSIVLMENAGRQVVTAIQATFDDASTLSYAILCGKGQNGGDGFVVARALREQGVDVAVYLVGRDADVRGDARMNLQILSNLSIDVVEIADAAAWELHAPAVLAADVVVDAIFGTGLTGPIAGLVESIVEDVNASTVPVVAIDMPSGLDASDPAVPGPAMDATLTVTFGAPKIPHVLPPAEDHVGSLVIADIGIPQSVIHQVEGPWVELLTKESMRAHVAPRAAESQKGDYGRVLVVAGSVGKTGAAHLTAMAALRSGAGLVTIATPASCVPILAGLGVEYMTLGLAENADGQVAFEAVDVVVEFDADIIVMGPGLGRSPSTSAFVHAVVERAGIPVILDADALHAFAGETDRLQGREDVPLVVTPHPGEMARLLDVGVDDVQARRLEVARDFAVTRHLHVVLKGHRTVVAAPDGRVSINMTGNPGMATGGTGDVLAGMIGAWCAQLLDPGVASQLAAYLHGLAGDLAAADEGEVAMIAGDVVDRLGDAVLDLTAQRRRPPPDGEHA
jgi:NAD(P)H-hydrate epimerase